MKNLERGQFGNLVKEMCNQRKLTNGLCKAADSRNVFALQDFAMRSLVISEETPEVAMGLLDQPNEVIFIGRCLLVIFVIRNVPDIRTIMRSH